MKDINAVKPKSITVGGGNISMIDDRLRNKNIRSSATSSVTPLSVIIEWASKCSNIYN
jgi:hypothetical protein